MFCWKCGARLAEGNDFCASCGARQTAQDSNTRDSQKKPVKLIALFAAVFIVSILVTVLVVSMGEYKDSASAAPGVSSSVPQSAAKPEAPASAVTPAPAAGEPEEDRERETSGAWKRGLYEWVKEQHGHIEASANRSNYEEGSYTIALFEYGESGLVGFTWDQSDGATPDGTTIVYAQDRNGDYAPGIDEYDLNRLYRNNDTGVADMLRSVNYNGVDSFYLEENGQWVRQFSLNPGDGIALAYEADETYREIPLLEAEAMREELLSGREEVTEFQEYTVLIEGESKGRVVPWVDIAGDFNDFLNDFDGIRIDLVAE